MVGPIPVQGCWRTLQTGALCEPSKCSHRSPWFSERSYGSGWCLLLQIQILAKESNQYAKSDIRRLSPKPTVHCSKQPAWPWQNPKHPTTGQQHCEVATNRFRRLTFGLPAELSVEAAFEASNALKLLE